MGRPTKTKSERWEVKGNPAKWEHVRRERGGGHGATDEPDIKKIGPWIEDMEEWSEMMHEALMELRERRRAPPRQRAFAELHELDTCQEPQLPLAQRPAGAKAPPTGGDQMNP